MTAVRSGAFVCTDVRTHADSHAPARPFKPYFMVTQRLLPNLHLQSHHSLVNNLTHNTSETTASWRPAVAMLTMGIHIGLWRTGATPMCNIRSFSRRAMWAKSSVISLMMPAGSKLPSRAEVLAAELCQRPKLRCSGRGNGVCMTESFSRRAY